MSVQRAITSHPIHNLIWYNCFSILFVADVSLSPIYALLVIDVQNCFIDGTLALSNSPARQNGAEVVPIINHLIETILFDYIVYSYDWHPVNHISFVDNLRNRTRYIKGGYNASIQVYDTVTYTGPKYETEQVLWPAHCIQNTDDAKLHPDLIVNPDKNNIIHIRKGTDPDIDSYSAFADNNKGQKTVLDTELKKRNVTHVIVAGLALDFCVGATALDAMDLNYKTFVVEDASRGITMDTIRKRLDEMTNRGIKIIKSSQVKQLVNNTIHAEFNHLFLIFISFFVWIFK
ncbi:unnamed protein product [Rotaria sp. Silwood2]|nr:unnamed protein product [Rotaria sp. Silwood2]